MKYYRIFNSSGKDVGTYPQIFNAEFNFHINHQNSYQRLNFTKADDKTLWPALKLSGKAKKTDLVSISLMGMSDKLFVSAKLCNILQNCRYQGVQFIKSELIIGKSKEEYWIVNPYASCISNLDVKESSFAYLKAIGSNEKEVAQFEDVNLLTKAFEENKINREKNGLQGHKPLLIEKVTLQSNLDADFFPLQPVLYGGFGYYISKEIKIEIEKLNCSGIVFTDVNERYP